MGNARRPFAVLCALTAAIVLGGAANAQAQIKHQHQRALYRGSAHRADATA